MISLVLERSGHCGRGNRCWSHGFYLCSKCRTLRALSCSHPQSIAARATKGDRVYVEGTLTLNTWTDAAKTDPIKSGSFSPPTAL